MLDEFTCPRCGMTSANEMDAIEGYCGACHDWTGDVRHALGYYDRDGNRIALSAWANMFEDRQQMLDYKRVGDTYIGPARVSTVWLGLDHRMGFLWPDEAGPYRPLIFETMVFGGKLDGAYWRYSTEAEALAGHEAVSASVRTAERPLALRVMDAAAPWLILVGLLVMLVSLMVILL